MVHRRVRLLVVGVNDVLDREVVHVAARFDQEPDERWPIPQVPPIAGLVLADGDRYRDDLAAHDVGDPPAVGAEPVVEPRPPAVLRVSGEAG